MILSIYCVVAGAVSAAFIAMALYGAWLSWREDQAEGDAGAVGPMGGRIGTTPGTTPTTQPRHDASQRAASDSETMIAEGWEGCRGYLDGEWTRALRDHRYPGDRFGARDAATPLPPTSRGDVDPPC